MPRSKAYPCFYLVEGMTLEGKRLYRHPQLGEAVEEIGELGPYLRQLAPFKDDVVRHNLCRTVAWTDEQFAESCAREKEEARSG